MDTIISAARELCHKECRAILCEREGRCLCPRGPGYSWFEKIFMREAEAKLSNALWMWRVE